MQIYKIPIDASQRETTLHGTAAFPLAVYETKIRKNILGFINWHWHEELQFCYVTHGTVTFFLNRRSFSLAEGEGIFIHSGILHMAKDSKNSDASYVCIDFSLKLLSSFSGSVFEEKYVLPYLPPAFLDTCLLRPTVPWQREILLALKEVHDLEAAHGFAYEFDICSRLGHIWKLLLLHGDKENQLSPASFTASQKRLHEILAYLQEHYTEKLSLKEVADHVHISPGECCRFFKKNMSCTIFDYLIDYRLDKSTDLLLHSDASVSQIAFETGFGSSSYYIEKFRKKTGMTPGEFRRRQ